MQKRRAVTGIPGALKAGLAGFVLAFVLFQWFPLLSYAFGFIRVPVHEFGHALVGWLYGMPSIPAFDFQYGGGVTMTNERSPQIAMGVVAMLLGVAYGIRRHVAWAVLSLFLAIWLAVSGWMGWNDLVMVAMGHGAELVFAGIFFYRAFAGASLRIAAERPLYALVAWLMWLQNLSFASKLIKDPIERIMYEEAKGGGHWMDFSQIAEVYLGIHLETVALAYFFLTLLVPAVAGFLAFTKAYWVPWLFVED